MQEAPGSTLKTAETTNCVLARAQNPSTCPESQHLGVGGKTIREVEGLLQLGSLRWAWDAWDPVPK